MPKIANHHYEAISSGKCTVGKHTKCRGTATIGIHALKRPCTCRCHKPDSPIELEQGEE